jgi:hypothetical protein
MNKEIFCRNEESDVISIVENWVESLHSRIYVPFKSSNNSNQVHTRSNFQLTHLNLHIVIRNMQLPKTQ